MTYLVLSNSTRQQLEQERTRLTSDRAQLVSDIESAITTELDHTLQTLNALLNEAPIAAVPADDLVESVAELLDHTATEPSPQTRSRSHVPQATRKTGTKQAKAEPKTSLTTAAAFDAKKLKSKFKGGLSEAIVQVLRQDPTKEYETDALIAALYDKFDPAEMPKARKTLGATLMHQRRAGVVEKIGDKSPRYKLG